MTTRWFSLARLPRRQLRAFTTKTVQSTKTSSKTVTNTATNTPTKKIPLTTTPSPSIATPAPNVPATSASSLALFAQGSLCISLAYGVIWGVETQSIRPTALPWVDIHSMCASGAGIAFALRASGCNPLRRLAVGTLAASYGLYGIASSTQRAGHRTKQRATAASPKQVAQDLSVSIVTMIPFLAASLSKKTIRFTSKNLIGFVLSSTCLLGATVCDFKPPELEFMWNYLETKSRHPNLFLEWLHWSGYIMLGGGAAAFLAGPVFMFGNICYNIMPNEEQSSAEEQDELPTDTIVVGDGHSYRHVQRTVSAFWPMKYSNRYISDHHLYETVVQKDSVVGESGAGKGPGTDTVLCGEWVVDIDVRPTYDQLLGREEMTWQSMLPKWMSNNMPAVSGSGSVSGEEEEGTPSGTAGGTAPATAVLISPSTLANGNNALEMRYTDGRAFRLVPIDQCTGKYKVLPLVPLVEDSENPVMQSLQGMASTVFNFIASDGFRLDPNEMWVVDVGGVGNEAYVVLSDGDMRSRYQALRRPQNPSGGLHPEVHDRLMKLGRQHGFVE